MSIIEQVVTILTSGMEVDYKEMILNMCQHLKVRRKLFR